MLSNQYFIFLGARCLCIGLMPAQPIWLIVHPLIHGTALLPTFFIVLLAMLAPSDTFSPSVGLK